METKKEISEELGSLSRVVGDISRQTPYQVPVGYFEGFSGRVLDLIRQGNAAGSPQTDNLAADIPATGSPKTAGPETQDPAAPLDIILNIVPSFADRIGRVTPYTVPAGYFEDFARKMLLRIREEQAAPLLDGSSLLAHSLSSESSLSDSSFSDSSFSDDAAPLSSREELSLLSPLLSGIDKKMPFTAPEGYFAELTATVVSGVQAIAFVNDELENLSPLMAGLQNRSTYQVPEGYFDSLAGKILERVNQPAAAKVVVMRRKMGWLKYAAAAVFGGLLLTGGWLNYHKSVPSPAIAGFDPNGLSRVSDQELESYLDNHNVPVAEAVTNSTATLDFTDNDIKSMLGDVSDAELKQYEEDQGGAKEPVTN